VIPRLLTVALLLAYCAVTMPACRSSSPTLEEKPSLVGVWNFQANGYKSELVIQPDGRYSKHDQYGGMMTLIRGEISVTEEPAVLRLNIRDFDPKETCGPLGCDPIVMPAAENYRFRLTANELVLTDERGQSYSYSRTQ